MSWLCQVSSIDFEQTLITCLDDIGPISLAYSAQQRKRLIVTTLFLMRGGVWARDYLSCWPY